MKLLNFIIFYLLVAHQGNRAMIGACMYQLKNSHQCSPPAHRKSPPHWCSNECGLSSEYTLISSLFLNETPSDVVSATFSGSTLIHMTHAHPEELHLSIVLLSYILSVETKQDTICLCRRQCFRLYKAKVHTFISSVARSTSVVLFNYPFYQQNSNLIK